MFGTVRQLPSRKDTTRKKYGRWQARYTAPNGQRVKAPATFPTKQDAQGWLAEERKLIDLGTWQPPEVRQRNVQEQQKREALTVGQWVTQWHQRQKPRLKLSTWQQYQRVIRNRITKVQDAPGVAKLANMPLYALDKQAVHDWWDAMNQHFPTPQTNRKAHIYLRAAVGDAVERDMLPTNPVSVRQARVKPQTKDKELPTTDTLMAIVEHTPQRYQLVMVLCLFMGLRIGEALALTREQLVNTGTAEQPQWVVQVRGNLQRVQDEHGRTYMRWQEPKTKAGRRDVPIFPRFNDIVSAHVEGFSPARRDGYLTTTRAGMPVMDTSLRSVLDRARKAAGVEQPVTPHYGRNWLIAHLAESGATPAEIGYLLGQTDLKTITEVYMKVRPENVTAVLGRVGMALDGGGAVVSLEGHKNKKRRGA